MDMNLLWVFIYDFLRPNKTCNRIKLHSVKINEKNTSWVNEKGQNKYFHGEICFSTRCTTLHENCNCTYTLNNSSSSSSNHATKSSHQCQCVFFFRNVGLRKCLITFTNTMLLASLNEWKKVWRFQPTQIGSCSTIQIPFKKNVYNLCCFTSNK